MLRIAVTTPKGQTVAEAYQAWSVVVGDVIGGRGPIPEVRKGTL